METRGNIHKLVPVRCEHELRFFFSNRVVAIWNSLPNSVVPAESVDSFKTRLDKYWMMYDFVYDYRADPLATGSDT